MSRDWEYVKSGPGYRAPPPHAHQPGAKWIRSREAWGKCPIKRGKCPIPAAEGIGP